MIIAVIAMDWQQSHMRPVGIPYCCYTTNAITVARFWQEVLFLIGARVNGDITLRIVLVFVDDSLPGSLRSSLPVPGS